ncbi:MAG: DUF3810 domain-containing protein [Oscillospiraceae bacterium]|nr:DUF3810 domain-containing protein [Oscillospiraceae bacterium]
MKKIFCRENRRMHAYFAAVLALIAASFLIGRNDGAVEFFKTRVDMPLKHFLAGLCSAVPFSVGEIIIILAVIGALWYLVRTVTAVIKAKDKGPLLYRRFMRAVCFLLTVALLLLLGLGPLNRSRSFQENSGIYAVKSDVETLYKVTRLFADMANRTGAGLDRDGSGVFTADLDSVLAAGTSVYDELEKQFPFLSMKAVKPKKLLLSRLFSACGYTGFYFPITGEANLNSDSPICMIPSTAAHEMAHQRGVAREQEANFVAVLACTSCDDPVYQYSGWLMGYVNLSNALYRQDEELWGQVRSSLADHVVSDLRANSEYWAQFDKGISKVAGKVSDSVYNTYLKSSGQELGLRSYGAVVDLLIAYYG